MPLGKVKVTNIVNVHDSGKLINPSWLPQVHGGMSMDWATDSARSCS